MNNWYHGLDAENVVYAVSCGASEPFTDINGIKYRADEGFSAGRASADGSFKKKWNVPNTDVYQSERWNDDDFEYYVPVDLNKDSTYTLVLKFSEVYFDAID